MKDNKLYRIIILQFIVILILIWLVTIYGKDEFQKDINEEIIEIDQSKVIGNKIWLSKISQDSIGMFAEQPYKSTFQKKEDYHGIVVNFEDLIEANKHYNLNKSRLTEFEIILSQKKQDLGRMYGLYNSGRRVSKRQLELSELEYEEAKRRLSETQSEIEAISQSVKLNWSNKLSNGLGKKSGLLYEVVNGKSDIVRVSIPSSSNINKYSWFVYPSGLDQSVKFKATLLGPSGVGLRGETGETWLLKSNTLNLATSSSVVVEAISKDKIPGVLIPENAFVRFAGESWVYVKNDKNYFERILIKTNYSNKNGIFSTKIKPYQLVVTIGAQTLLSEELRHQIKNENED